MMSHKKAPISSLIKSIAILLLLVLELTTNKVVTYGQVGGWSQPVLLSSQFQSSWFPDVAVDQSGRVHIAWATNTTGFDTVVYTESNNGRDWSTSNDIMALPNASGTEVTRPALLADSNGFLQMTFRGTAVFYSHAPTDLASSARAWSTPLQINRKQVGYFSRLAIDSRGVLHLVYTENTPSGSCPICYHVYYLNSKDNGQTWSQPVDLSLTSGAAKPQILIDDQDNIHVVWESGNGGSYGQLSDPTKVMYTASYDKGQTWTSPIEFTQPVDKGTGTPIPTESTTPVSATALASGTPTATPKPENQMARNIAIGLDGNHNLLVVWWSIPSDIVYFQTSSDQGRTWSIPKPIPGVLGAWKIYTSRLDDYSMATDSAGQIHLVMVGRYPENEVVPSVPPDSLSVFHLIWDGSSWSQPEAISTLVGDVPEWPRIAVGIGNQLHVVWFVRDQAHIWDSTNGQYEVWYSHGSSSAPAILPVALPQVTDMPAPTSIATPDSSPTLMVPNVNPTIAFTQSSDDTAMVYTESGYLLVLAKSLFPAMLVIAVVIIILRRRMH